jgi:hypothetical protein
MSSYCYALMTVAFLQVSHPPPNCFPVLLRNPSQSRGVLPNLQEDLAEAKDSEGYWLRQKGLRIWCDPRFHYRPALGWKPQPITMEEALLGWFRSAWLIIFPFTYSVLIYMCLRPPRYWATEHDYEWTISSIKYGGLIQRAEPYHLPVGAPKKRRGKGKRPDVLYTPAERAMMTGQKGLAVQDQARPELTEVSIIDTKRLTLHLRLG